MSRSSSCRAHWKSASNWPRSKGRGGRIITCPPVDLRELKRTVATALKSAAMLKIVRQFEALERARRIDAQDLLSRSTDRLSQQNRIVRSLAKSRERPNISALSRSSKSPTHHHPRPARVDPARSAQAGGLSRVEKSDERLVNNCFRPRSVSGCCKR